MQEKVQKSHSLLKAKYLLQATMQSSTSICQTVSHVVLNFFTHLCSLLQKLEVWISSFESFFYLSHIDTRSMTGQQEKEDEVLDSAAQTKPE